MSQAKKAPAYNLKVVLQLTGIKPDTLRAWERRYGLPLPQRTAGGHRLYSQYDIETIKWLMERQDEGMRINRAVDLWRDIEAEGKDPLDVMHPVASAEPSEEQPIMTGSSLDEIRENWVESCLDFNELNAERILSQSFALYPVEMVCLEVLRRGIVDIGSRWYRGEATVQQEHFASGLVLRRLEALIAASPAPTRSERILVGCPAQEDHVIALLMTTLFLRRHGLDVIYLGANVPLADLEKAGKRIKARLVILIASQLHTAANLAEAARMIRAEGIPLAFAGSIFTRRIGLIESIPGYYLGDRLSRVAQEVEAVLKYPGLPTEISPVSNEYQQAKIKIEDRQSTIKAEIWNELKNNSIDEHTLRVANDALIQDILAALTFNNIEILQDEIDWVGALITQQGLSNKLLPEYLRVFANAIDRQTGEAAKLVSDWLRTTALREDIR
jgi:DNA-binding transcriptional MerR regulator/methylmalonyl-CoA mutase cobalamin-binding subunit